jgi:hypothetical protein
MTTAPVLVVQTWYLRNGVYEVEVADRAWTPRLRLVTPNFELYRDCLNVEGLDVRVIVTYHRALGDNVIDEVLPAPPEGIP